jgi:type IV secretory pathway VirB10-like protein
LWSGRVAAILVVSIAIASLFKLAPNETNFENNVAELTEINTAKEEKESSPEIKVAPVKPKKSEPIKKKKPKAKPALKKAEPEKKQHKSIRETTKGRLENEDIAMLRIPLDIPAEMQAISATLDVKPPKATMATMYISYPDEYYEEEWLLADQVKEKFSFNKITKAGLDLVASISNNNFTYQTNSEGKVTEYNYDSRLLAFSVPHNRTNSK